MRCPDFKNDLICKECEYHGKRAAIEKLEAGKFDYLLQTCDNICTACEYYGRIARLMESKEDV